MRNRIIFNSTFFLIIILFFAISCKEGCLDPNALNYDPNSKKSNDELCEYENSNKKSLLLELHHKFDNIDFNLDSIYHDDFGTMLKFNRATFYVSKNCFLRIQVKLPVQSAQLGRQKYQCQTQHQPPPSTH